jgi:hypothetical protein
MKEQAKSMPFSCCLPTPDRARKVQCEKETSMRSLSLYRTDLRRLWDLGRWRKWLRRKILFEPASRISIGKDGYLEGKQTSRMV